MSAWCVETFGEEVVKLARQETMTVRVGDHFEIKPNKRWAGGNRAQIIALLPHGFHGRVLHENRRSPGSQPTTLGEFEVPYSAMGARIY